MAAAGATGGHRRHPTRGAPSAVRVTTVGSPDRQNLAYPRCTWAPIPPTMRIPMWCGITVNWQSPGEEECVMAPHLDEHGADAVLCLLRDARPRVALEVQLALQDRVLARTAIQGIRTTAVPFAAVPAQQLGRPGSIQGVACHHLSIIPSFQPQSV